MAEAKSDRRQALDLAIAQIERQFGKGAVMRLGAGGPLEEIATIPTGALSLDVALGVGGLPRGRVCEIFGPESSGKTTLALHVVAEAQRLGGIAAFIDAEHALDPIYARRLGVNTDELLISQPDTGEQALEITESLVRSNAVDVIVIDSVAALVPRAELDGDMGDSLPGLQARLMSQALRKLTAAISRSGSVVIFINQIREKIGVMFGSPETTPGGRALKFYASVRLDIRRMDAIKQGTESVGVRTKVKVVKNKLAPPFREAEFDVIYGEGVSKSGTVLDAGVEQGLIEKSGTWYTYKNERIGQGRENARSGCRRTPPRSWISRPRSGRRWACERRCPSNDRRPASPGEMIAAALVSRSATVPSPGLVRAGRHAHDSRNAAPPSRGRRGPPGGCGSLSRHAWTCSDLATRLRRRGASPEAGRGDRRPDLVSRSYLGDARFAQQWVEARSARGYGPARPRGRAAQPRRGGLAHHGGAVLAGCGW
jgi:recombination protein RecA